MRYNHMWSLEWKAELARLQHTLVLFAHLPISNSLAHVLGAAICIVVDVERDVRDYFETRAHANIFT